MSAYNCVIQFWFQGADDSVIIDKNRPPFNIWFGFNEQFDQRIKEKFKIDIQKAKNGDYQEWKEAPEGRLALILMFDQFTRNIYRRTPKMYENDSLALALANDTIGLKLDEQLPLLYRVFIYMPLMHAEDLRIQKLSVEKFERLYFLSKTKCPLNTAYYLYHLNFARKFLTQIEENGHFLHRTKSD